MGFAAYFQSAFWQEQLCKVASVYVIFIICGSILGYKEFAIALLVPDMNHCL